MCLKMHYEEIQTQNFQNIHFFHKLLSDENKVPRILSSDGKLAGSATYKQSKTVWSCVDLQGQFVTKNEEFV